MVSMSSNGQNGEGNVSLIGSAGNGGNNIVDSGGPSRSGITSSVECNNNNNNVNRNCNMSDSPTWKALQDPSKMNKIRDIVENSTSVSSKCLVDSLLQQVNQLSDVEKCLLYLKLPVGRSPELDPLKQPLNPLGSRSEIQLTITWMKTHLGIDLEVSLPKEEVYNEYKLYCANNDFKPLSTADFGKVMKQVFPSVRARRLGQRGQSKYCHSGLRKNYVLDVPALPDLLNNSSLTENNANNKNLFGLETPLFDECQKASLLVIMEWAEKHFNVKFETLKDLALFLLENKCVDNRSTAAFTLIASDPSAGNANSAGKHRETQFQLQKRLQEREQKRKLQEQQPGVSRSCPDRPKTRRRSGASRNASGGSGDGRSTAASGGGGCFANSKACADNVEAKVSVTRNGRHETTKKETVNEIKQNVEVKNAVNVLSCIKQEDRGTSRLNFSSVFIGNEDKGSGENALCHLKPSQKYMRGSSCEDSNPSNNNNSTFVKGTTSNSNSTYLNLMLPNVTSATSKNRYKPIQPKVGQCENNNNINNNNINNNINNNNNNNNNSAYTNKANNNNKSGISQYSEQSQLLDIRSPLESFSGPHSALIMDQAQTNFSSNNPPSVDQDDFMPSYSSCEVVDIQKSTQLSELRKLLQKNLPGGSASPSCIGIAPVSLGLPDDHTVDLDQDALNSAAIRRKVSFQTSLDGSENSVVTSPIFAPNLSQVSHINNSSCTKAYNFTPIPNPSGGGLSQGVSQASSANASPFMSPRNTPLPRSRHNSGQTSSTYVTPRSTPYTPDLALPAGITSENSTPFMSPAPTPIFPRSRHNSSQNMRPHYTPTCRTRHSSGAPSYRHTPYADDLSGRRNGNKNRHFSGSIPPSPQSAPLSPLVHDSGGHPLSETLIFHQQIHSAALIQGPHSSMGNNNNDLRRRHMSAGPTIHYQPQHQPQTQTINYINSGGIACNDLLSQEVSNVLNNPQHGGGCIPASNVNRPQSVPLPQMLNTSCADMDYAKSHPNTPLVNQPFQFTQDCNLSHQSSYAPTPVPSEYNDFGDYSNLEFDPVLTGDTSGTTNSALESIDASFSGLSSHSDFNSAISDSFCTVPNNVTSIVESSYGDSAGVRYSQCDDSLTQGLRNTIDSSCCTVQSNISDKNSIVSHAREVILGPKAEQHHNSQSLMLGGNTSHITLNALNAHTVLGLGISDQAFDHPTSHLEDEFQATLMDFPDQDFNNLVLDVSKD